jgi:peroxiredoxin
MPRRSLSLAALASCGALAVACSSTPESQTADGSSPSSTTSAPASSSSPVAALTGGPANDPAMTADGPKAPDFTLPLVDGGQMSLSDFAGKKVVLLDFWSTTCDPCMVEMPHLVDLYKKYKDRGLVVLAVSLDGPESLAQVNSVIHDKGMVFPVLLDEETTVISRYNPKKDMPTSVVIAKNGSIVYKHGGYTAGDENKIADAIAKLIP